MVVIKMSERFFIFPLDEDKAFLVFSKDFSWAGNKMFKKFLIVTSNDEKFFVYALSANHAADIFALCNSDEDLPIFSVIEVGDEN